MINALLDKNPPKPSAAQKKQALSGNLCRCGMNIRILRVLKRRRAIGLSCSPARSPYNLKP
jgi:aerobic-type carbon monoxide dehydrogenase small subunit (CoxS/CutS family)